MRYALVVAVLTAGCAGQQMLPDDTSQVQSLTVRQANELAWRKGGLNLNGLTALSPKVAKALSPHEDALYLNGLTTLSDEAAEALSQHQWLLSLNGLTTLSDEAAAALARHRGIVHLKGLNAISLGAYKALRANPGNILPEQDHFRRGGGANTDVQPDPVIEAHLEKDRQADKARNAMLDDLSKNPLTTTTPDQAARFTAQKWMQKRMTALKDTKGPKYKIGKQDGYPVLLEDGTGTTLPDIIDSIINNQDIDPDSKMKLFTWYGRHKDRNIYTLIDYLKSSNYARYMQDAQIRQILDGNVDYLSADNATNLEKRFRELQYLSSER